MDVCPWSRGRGSRKCGGDRSWNPTSAILQAVCSWTNWLNFWSLFLYKVRTNLWCGQVRNIKWAGTGKILKACMANWLSVDPCFSFPTLYFFLGALSILDWPQFISSSKNYVGFMATLGPCMIMRYDWIGQNIYFTQSSSDYLDLSESRNVWIGRASANSLSIFLNIKLVR